MTTPAPIPPYAAGLIDAADLLIREAQKLSHVLAAIEDEDGDEAHLCAMEIQCLERMADRILALKPAATEPEIKF